MRFFDITRLCKRAESNAPSGIDRVDLAYLQWLHELGPMDYLVNGMSGFTQVNRRRGEALLSAIKTKWQGNHEPPNLDNFSDLQDTSHRYRMASKKWARRNRIEKNVWAHNLNELCHFSDSDLNLLDVSAHLWAYRVDPAWRGSRINGHFFGISHSMLSRTAYMATLAKHKKLKRVLFIHDTIPCDFPEFCLGKEGGKHLLRIRNAFRYGTHIVVNSEYTKQRLDHWRTMLGEKELPIEVISIGVDEGLLNYARNAPDRVAVSRPYFVILGTIEPRKNHALLLDVWRSFVNTLPKESVPELLIIGKRGWKNEEVFQILDNCESLRGHVREMNRISDDQLWPLLKGARAMLFPSFVEGWGMPLVEALALGVPVVASDIPAFHEAGQGVSELISPSNGSEWAERIIDYVKPESTRRSEQQQRLKKYCPPTWSEHFAKVQAMLGDETFK